MPAAPSRRTVIRTTVWAVPAVSVAAATPAFAASTTFATGTGPDSNFKWAANNAYIEFPTKIVWAAPNPTALTVIYVIPNGIIRNNGTIAISNLTGGWQSVVTYTGNGINRYATITVSRTDALAGTEISLSFRAAQSNTGNFGPGLPGPVSVTVNASNKTSSTFTASIASA